MIEALAPFFLHPAIAAAGAACAAVPVVIHLINRLRFRRVRFAAMEFLLASEQRNRRRVLIEQLLLLLLRVLIVLAAAALVARLVLDPATLSALRGGEAAHHVVVLDDSGSMRAFAGGESSFAAAKRALRDFAAEAAREAGGARLSVLLLSRAGGDSALFARREVTTGFLSDLAEKLDALEPTHARHRPAAGLDAAARRLGADDGAGERVVHLLSDFRAADWGGAGDALGEAGGDGGSDGDAASAVRRLDAAGVRVNLVRVAAAAPPNLRVTDVSFGSPTAAVGVPVRVRATVENLSDVAAAGVELAPSLDGQALPLGATVPTLEPGESAVREFDVQFDAPGRHTVAVSVAAAGGDGLGEDDAFARPLLALPRVPALVVDGSADLAGATLIARTFDADLTGREVRVGGPDLLRKEDLSKFWTVYVVNVPRLPADAVAPLERFVRGGGGLIWYGGEVDADHYTDVLHAAGLFPVPLAGPSRELRPDDGGGPDVRFRPHPVTAAVTAGENLFADLVTVDRYLPVPREWERDDAARDDGVETLAVLRDGSPLVLASTLGDGRVLAVLTTASTDWTDWPRNPAFPLFQLPAQEWADRTDSGDAVGVAGEPLRFDLDAAAYRPDVLIERPDELSATLTATPRLAEGELGLDGAPVTPDELRLTATYAETDLPGVYEARLVTTAGEPVVRRTSLNFPPAEGLLSLVPEGGLTGALAETKNVTVRSAGEGPAFGGGGDAREVRWWLLGGLCLLLAGEQWLAYRCGYHGGAA